MKIFLLAVGMLGVLAFVVLSQHTHTDHNSYHVQNSSVTETNRIETIDEAVADVNNKLADAIDVSEKRVPVFETTQNEQLIVPIKDLVAKYLEAPREEQLYIASRISHATAFTDTDQSAEIEEQMFDAILYGTEQDKLYWSQFLADVGARSEPSHTRIISTLESTTDKAVVASLITALLPVHVDEDHKAWVSENIRPYVSDEDEFVRASATLTQSLWVDGADRNYVIQTGFSDQSLEVRFSAATAATLSDQPTSEVKHSLFTIISNPHEESFIREQALNALDGYQLNPQELEIISQHDFR